MIIIQWNLDALISQPRFSRNECGGAAVAEEEGANWHGVDLGQGMDKEG